MGRILNYAIALFGGFLAALLLVWILSPLTIGTNRTLISFYVTTILQAALPISAAGVLALMRRYPELVLLLGVTGLLILFYNLIALWAPIFTTSYL